MTNFFELLSTSDRAPMTILERLTQAAADLFNRRRNRRRRIERAMPAFLRSNHIRRDVGLPPIDFNGWPL